MSISPFGYCADYEALARRMASEYAQPPRAVPGEYWVLKDQVERQPPGPGPQHDSLYGEPVVPVRPELSSPTSAQTWNFRGPYPINFVLTSLQDAREIMSPGSTLTRTIAASVAALALDENIPCVPTPEQVANRSPLLGRTQPKPGDVVYIAGNLQLYFDIDEVNPTGFLTAASLPVSYDLTLVRRSKWVPERKDGLPSQDEFPPLTDAGTGEEP